MLSTVCVTALVLAIVLGLIFNNYSATPQRAATQAASLHSTTQPVVLRTNIVGRYATVLIGGAFLEGSTVEAPILVERFSFGWQALEVLNFRCRLDSHNLGASIDAMLMRLMPKANDNRPCQNLSKDAGPSADVEAVRSMMHGSFVPYVVVSGNWAMGEWYGGSGGESLYHKRERAWQPVSDGGGAMGVREMREYGVPQTAWCAFGIYDAKCRFR